jgi:hypothetical protein
VAELFEMSAQKAETIKELNRIQGIKTWEARVREYEEQGCTRSDAQAIVDAEDQREKPCI